MAGEAMAAQAAFGTIPRRASSSLSGLNLPGEVISRFGMNSRVSG
jgi:hypothetical protein